MVVEWETTRCAAFHPPGPSRTLFQTPSLVSCSRCAPGDFPIIYQPFHSRQRCNHPPHPSLSPNLFPDLSRISRRGAVQQQLNDRTGEPGKRLDKGSSSASNRDGIGFHIYKKGYICEEPGKNIISFLFFFIFLYSCDQAN